MNVAAAQRGPAISLLRTLRRMGYVITVDEGKRFKLRGPSSRLSEELSRAVRVHRDELVCLVEEEIVVDEREVSEMAHAHFGEIAPEHRQEAPYAAPEPGCDPMAHKHTDKALWFAGARERELERRRRYGLPSHIRLVDGGAS